MSTHTSFGTPVTSGEADKLKFGNRDQFRKIASLHSWILVVFLCFIFVVNALWLAIDHRPPRWDESANLFLAEEAYQRLIDFDWSKLLLTNGTARPNFIPLLSAFTFPLVGRDYATTVFIQSSVSLLIVSLCLYGIGTRMLGRTAGLLAVALYNTLPGVALWSRYYTSDLPLTATTTSTIWLAILYLAEPTWRTRTSTLLGVSIGVGMCVKHFFPVFVALPLIYLLYVLLKGSNWRLQTFLRTNFSLIFSLGGGIAFGLIYHLVINFQGFYDGILRAFFSDSVYGSLGYVAPRWEQVLQGVFAFQFGNSFLLLSTVVLGSFFILVLRPPAHFFIWYWLGGTFVFFVFVLGFTMPYYFHAVTPALALLASGWAMRGPRHVDPVFRRIRQLQAVVCIVVGVIALRSYLHQSLGTSSPLKVLAVTADIFRSGKRPNINPLVDEPYWTATYVDGNTAFLPYPHDWPVDDVLKTVREAIPSRGFTKPFVIGLGTDYEWFNTGLFNYRIKHFAMDDGFQLVPAVPVPAREMPEKFFSRFQILIVKSGDVFKRDFYSYSWASETQMFYDQLVANDYRTLRNAGWQLHARMPLPDRSEVSVWTAPNLTTRSN